MADDDRGLYLGLISGTSADGIDAALVDFDFDDGCRLRLGRTYPWTPVLRERLVALGQGADAASLDELGALDLQVADAFAAAARALRSTGRSRPSSGRRSSCTRTCR